MAFHEVSWERRVREPTARPPRPLSTVNAVGRRRSKSTPTSLAKTRQPPQVRRIAADLDKLSEVPNDSQAEREREANQHDPQARHRRELAEPSPEPKELSHREERMALRAELGLPPD